MGAIPGCPLLLSQPPSLEVGGKALMLFRVFFLIQYVVPSRVPPPPGERERDMLNCNFGVWRVSLEEGMPVWHTNGWRRQLLEHHEVPKVGEGGSVLYVQAPSLWSKALWQCDSRHFSSCNLHSTEASSLSSLIFGRKLGDLVRCYFLELAQLIDGKSIRGSSSPGPLPVPSATRLERHL